MIQTVLHLSHCCNYADGEKRYILAPQGLQVGATVISGDAVAPELGNALAVEKYAVGYYGSQY